MKRLLKHTIALLLFVPGLRTALLRWRFRNRALVLMYHRVLDPCVDTCSNPAIVVSTNNFRQQIEYLRRNFQLVDLDGFRRLQGTGVRHDRPLCLITFDDGWIDNSEYALPILESNSAPALIFLPTHYIGTGHLFWQEQMTRLICRLHACRTTQDPATLERFGIYDLGDIDPFSLRKHVTNVTNGFKHCSYDEIEAMLTELRRKAGPDPDWGYDRYIDWSCVSDMSRRGVEFGSHGCSHRIMTSLSNAEIEREVSASASAIEEVTGQVVHAMAYPNGDVDERVREHVQAVGMQIAFTTRPGTVAPSDDPLQLRRIGVHDGSAPTLPHFHALVIGVF